MWVIRTCEPEFHRSNTFAHVCVCGGGISASTHLGPGWRSARFHGPAGMSGSRQSVLSVLISFITPALRFAAFLRRGEVELRRFAPTMTFSTIEEEIARATLQYRP